ncbi:MAG: GWxTD domain-containing protein [Ignavibacteriaceae bacterium]
MIKKIIFLSVLIITQLFAQPHNFRREWGNFAKTNSFYFSEIHSIPKDSVNQIYFAYRINYSRLVFVKSSGKYSASFSFSIEVNDSASKHVTRQIQNKNITVDNFDETLNKDNYIKGVITFFLSNGSFNILPFLTDLNTNHEMKLPPLHVDTRLINHSNFISPLIVKPDKLNCGSEKYFELANFDNSFPFGINDFNLIIPCPDTTQKSIYVVIKNNTDTVFNSEVSNYFRSNIALEECGSNIVLGDQPNQKRTNNFIINNIGNKLAEGETEIFLGKGKDSLLKKPFIKKVIWFNKPFSLRDPEKAIKLLKYIESDSVISKMLNANFNDYEKELYNYWKKYDPSLRNTFNPLMDEYYLRIDYAAQAYSLISGKSGIETDRGKIYIQFGKPQKIERASNQYGKVVETWIYDKPQRQFIFVDDDGAGNFKLRK